MDRQEQGTEDQILVAIRRVIRAIDLQSRALLEQCGLTGPQLSVLKALSRQGGMSGVDLATELQVGQATVSGILERLESRGLITRSRNGDDRRSISAALTSEGKRLVEAAPPLLQERFRKELSALPEWERTLMLAMLQKIAAMMHAEELGATPHLVTGPDRL